MDTRSRTGSLTSPFRKRENIMVGHSKWDQMRKYLNIMLVFIACYLGFQNLINTARGNFAYSGEKKFESKVPFGANKHGKTVEKDQKERPAQNIILSSPFRGSSSIVGELFNRNKQIFYLFEPLYFFGPIYMQPKNYMTYNHSEFGMKMIKKDFLVVAFY